MGCEFFQDLVLTLFWKAGLGTSLQQSRREKRNYSIGGRGSNILVQRRSLLRSFLSCTPFSNVWLLHPHEGQAPEQVLTNQWGCQGPSRERQDTPRRAAFQARLLNMSYNSVSEHPKRIHHFPTTGFSSIHVPRSQTGKVRDQPSAMPFAPPTKARAKPLCSDCLS